MDQAPRLDGLPVGERSVEQATRERQDDDAVQSADHSNGHPVPFAIPERLQVVASTNRYLVGLARAGLPDGSEVPEGYAVVAEHQSEGRGRLGRSWVAPPGSAVLCSILFRPDLSPDQLHLTAWAVALAAARACRAVAGVELSVKWPNDLLARTGGSSADAGSEAGRVRAERKVAGILSEVLAPRAEEAAGGPAARARGGVVVGIGINVNWPADWPPADSKDPELASVAVSGTSLNRVAGREIDRSELIGWLLRCAGRHNAMLASDQGRRSLAREYRMASATIGREVRVELAGETVVGRALDIDDAGSLLVSTGACIRTISAGDVVHVR